MSSPASTSVAATTSPTLTSLEHDPHYRRWVRIQSSLEEAIADPRVLFVVGTGASDRAGAGTTGSAAKSLADTSCLARVLAFVQTIVRMHEREHARITAKYLPALLAAGTDAAAAASAVTPAMRTAARTRYAEDCKNAAGEERAASAAMHRTYRTMFVHFLREACFPFLGEIAYPEEVENAFLVLEYEAAQREGREVFLRDFTPWVELDDRREERYANAITGDAREVPVLGATVFVETCNDLKALEFSSFWNETEVPAAVRATGRTTSLELVGRWESSGLSEVAMEERSVRSGPRLVVDGSIVVGDESFRTLHQSRGSAAPSSLREVTDPVTGRVIGMELHGKMLRTSSLVARAARIQRNAVRVGYRPSSYALPLVLRAEDWGNAFVRRRVLECLSSIIEGTDNAWNESPHRYPLQVYGTFVGQSAIDIVRSRLRASGLANVEAGASSSDPATSGERPGCSLDRESDALLFTDVVRSLALTADPSLVRRMAAKFVALPAFRIPAVTANLPNFAATVAVVLGRDRTAKPELARFWADTMRPALWLEFVRRGIRTLNSPSLAFPHTSPPEDIVRAARGPLQYASAMVAFLHRLFEATEAIVREVPVSDDTVRRLRDLRADASGAIAGGGADGGAGGGGGGADGGAGGGAGASGGRGRDGIDGAFGSFGGAVEGWRSLWEKVSPADPCATTTLDLYLPPRKALSVAEFDTSLVEAAAEAVAFAARNRSPVGYAALASPALVLASRQAVRELIADFRRKNAECRRLLGEAVDLLDRAQPIIPWLERAGATPSEFTPLALFEAWVPSLWERNEGSNRAAITRILQAALDESLPRVRTRFAPIWEFEAARALEGSDFPDSDGVRSDGPAETTEPRATLTFTAVRKAFGALAFWQHLLRTWSKEDAGRILDTVVLESDDAARFHGPRSATTADSAAASGRVSWWATWRGLRVWETELTTIVRELMGADSAAVLEEVSGLVFRKNASQMDSFVRALRDMFPGQSMVRSFPASAVRAWAACVVSCLPIRGNAAAEEWAKKVGKEQLNHIRNHFRDFKRAEESAVILVRAEALIKHAMAMGAMEMVTIKPEDYIRKKGSHGDGGHRAQSAKRSGRELVELRFVGDAGVMGVAAETGKTGGKKDGKKDGKKRK